MNQCKISEWFVTSSQESRNPSNSGNCCFSSGEEFSSTKNKQTEVGKAMWSSSKQNKNKKLRAIPEVTSFVTNLSLRGQFHWAWPKREILSLILWQKALEFTFWGLNTFLDVMEVPKPKKTFWPYGHFKSLCVVRPSELDQDVLSFFCLKNNILE